MSVVFNNFIIAFVCPVCFELYEKEVNIFELYSGLSLTCASACVSDSVTVAHKGDKLKITVECPICSDVHTFYVSISGVMKKELISFSCPEHGSAKILFLGQPDAVHKDALASLDISSYIDELDDELCLDYIIDNGIEERLDFLSDNGGLQCSCGSTDIEIEDLPDALSLVCRACGNTIRLPYTGETLEALSRDKFIF